MKLPILSSLVALGILISAAPAVSAHPIKGHGTKTSIGKPIDPKTFWDQQRLKGG